jgi:Dolichyl-phosphate-mannose-protein mannosyltransferase
MADQPVAPYRQRRWMIAILVVATTMRLGVFMLNYPFPPLQKDAAVYDKLAWNLLDGHGMSVDMAPPYQPLALRTPAYPGFLAVVYSLAGRQPDAVRLVQIALSVITCLLVTLIALRIIGELGAQVAGLAYAVLPSLVVAPSLLLSEVNQAFLVMLTIYCLSRGLDRPRRFWFASSGLLLGLATLNKPDVQLVFAPLYGAVLAVANGRREIRRHVVVAILIFAAVVTPWVARNWLAFDRFIGVATGTGYAAMVSKLEMEGHIGDRLHEALEARYGADFRRTYGRQLTFLDGALPDQDALRRSEILVFIRSEPATYAVHTIRRFANLWLPRSWSDMFGMPGAFGEYARSRDYTHLVVKGGMLALDVAVIGLGWVGLALSLPQGRFAPLQVFVLYMSVMLSLIHAVDRYRLPVMGCVIIFAAYAVIRCGSSRASLRPSSALPSAAGPNAGRRRRRGH